jgi:CheY-like chemotaxis protein
VSASPSREWSITFNVPTAQSARSVAGGWLAGMAAASGPKKLSPLPERHPGGYESGQRRPPRPEATMPRVLVVDDNPDAAESLAILLRCDGHDVRAVTGAFPAFDVLAEFTPDVCLLDLRMPVLDGFTLAERLREELGPRVRLLALTGEQAAASDPRAGVFERVLTKPPDLDELLAAVAVPPAR